MVAPAPIIQAPNREIPTAVPASGTAAGVGSLGSSSGAVSPFVMQEVIPLFFRQLHVPTT